MLCLRIPQVAVLAELDGPGVIESLLDYLYERHPDRLQALGPARARERVEEAHQIALTRGLATSRRRALLVELVLLFGPRFHRDPSCAWARPLLEGAPTHDWNARVGLLHAHGMFYAGREGRAR